MRKKEGGVATIKRRLLSVRNCIGRGKAEERQIPLVSSFYEAPQFKPLGQQQREKEPFWKKKIFAIRGLLLLK
jgi:hypothetical protein